MRRTHALLGVAAALLAFGGAAAARAEPPARGARLTFAVSAAGLRVLTIETFFRFGPQSYRVDSLARTVGVAHFFHPGEQLTSATGTWSGNRAVPYSYVSDGHWSGNPRRVVIAYKAGQPVVRERIGPPGLDTAPIAPALLAGASNLPSAFAEMIRDAQATGRCETEVRAFDGRVLTKVVSRSAGEVEMDESAYRGPALRCDYASDAIAGLAAAQADNGPAPPVQHGTIWLGQLLPGYPRLPVQLSFTTRWFGEVTAHLIAAEEVPTATAQAARPHS